MDFRSNIASNLYPYSPGTQPIEDGWLKLNTNEFPWPPAPNILNQLAKIAKQPDLLRRYPPPTSAPLTKKIAKNFSISQESIITVNGSDEALALLCRGLLNPKDICVTPMVSYSLYSTLINSVGSIWKGFPNIEKNFSVEISNLALFAQKHRARLIFLPNPNALTGEFFSIKELERTIKENSEIFWVIDEAYNDFCDQTPSSMLMASKKLKNLAVIRTFSKSHSLAGLRLGYLVSSNKVLTEALLAMKDSYNVNRVAMELGLIALDESIYYQEKINELLELRTSLIETFEERGWICLPSQANFVLTKPPGVARDWFQYFFEKKILVRHFKNDYIKDWLRISIGTNKEMIQLFQVVDSF